MSAARHALAVLVSGGGRSLENLYAEIDRGALPASIALVVSTRADAYALERARAHDTPTAVIDPVRELAPADYGRAVFEALEAAGAELVVMAGFLRLLPIPERWLGRVINIHPSLLPAFGGQGFYGDRVHRAVLERGCQITGCTVHYVDNEYDAGPILLQRAVPVERDDTVETLAARVFEAEQRALPDAIRMHLAGEAPAPRF